MQPIVINENNELVDGQRRILAYEQLGEKEIPIYRIDLEQIVLGEFHANSNRKDFTSSERVAISIAVEKYLQEHSRTAGRPAINKKTYGNIIKDSVPSHNPSSSDVSKNNVVKLTKFSGRLKDNVSKYFGISRNTLDKEKRIVEAAENDSQSFEELRQRVDRKKISVDKGFKIIQKKIERDQIIAAAREATNDSNETLLHGDFREQSNKISDCSVDLVFTDLPIIQRIFYSTKTLQLSLIEY